MSSMIVTPISNAQNTTTANNTEQSFINPVYPLEIIPYETFEILQSANLIISQGASLMGVANNVINIVVFVKLGLRETTSISMMSLAVSDLLLCVLSLWSNLLFFPPFLKLKLPFRPEEIFVVTGGTHRLFVSRTSALIITFISLERCLCVITPLKVKTIITRGRTSVAMVTIFLFTIGPSFFLFGNYRFVHQFYPDVNRTLLGYRYVDKTANNIADKVISTAVGTVFPFVTFGTTCVCTVYLVVHLSRTSKWRQSHSNAGATAGAAGESSDPTSRATNAPQGTGGSIASDSRNKQASGRQTTSKEDRVARMVVVVSVVFIVCFLPTCVSSLLYAYMPGFSMYGYYGQMFVLMYTVGFSAESLNSSVNFFIYFKMGTNFRGMIYQMFKIQEKK